MKFYVVFKGKNPGVYDSWEETLHQVNGFQGAVYKGYASSSEAAEAFRKWQVAEDAQDLKKLLFSMDAKRSKVITVTPPEAPEEKNLYPPEVDTTAWAVDASCLGNPGTMEYRGIDLATGKVLFTVGPFKKATNNIGEFLAIVHAMALMTKEGKYHNIYSDSKTGMSWVRNKRVKTMLTPTPENKKVFELMARAVTWLQTHTFPARLMKWETEQWGEIPADFGRK